MIRLVQRYGAEVLTAATQALIASSERRMRAAISTLPDGVFRADDLVDGDGLDDEPLRVCVAVERRGDSLHVDFTGTAPQTRGPINSPIASTESAVYYAVTAILDPGIAPNHGSYLPIEVVAPYGSVLNPKPPAPVVGRNVLTHRIATVVMAALGEAVPARAVAPYYGNSNVYVLSAVDDDGRANVQFEIEVGGWGGRPGLDGPDCLSAGVHNLANNPIELVENEFPLRVIRYAFRQDSGGAGRFRGGLGVERTFELLADASCRRSSTGSSSHRPGSTAALQALPRGSSSSGTASSPSFAASRAACRCGVATASPCSRREVVASGRRPSGTRTRLPGTSRAERSRPRRRAPSTAHADAEVA